MKAARGAGGVDLVVIAHGSPAAKMLSLIRRDPNFAPVPVIVVGGGSSLVAMAKVDKKMVLIGPGKGAEPVLEAFPVAMKLAIGKPLTPDEAADWSVRAAKAIRLLGLTGNKVYTISQAQTALIGILGDKRVAVSVASAQALTILPGAKAQQALAILADKADNANEVRVPAYEALAQSVRRYGNLLTNAQSQAVVDVVNSKIDLAVRKAAAGALGALNLSSDMACPLILESGGVD